MTTACRIDATRVYKLAFMYQRKAVNNLELMGMLIERKQFESRKQLFVWLKL